MLHSAAGIRDSSSETLVTRRTLRPLWPMWRAAELTNFAEYGNSFAEQAFLAQQEPAERKSLPRRTCLN